MYSWKTIRTVSAILLLLPIVHLAFLLSREALATLDSSPEVWNTELEAYARADRLTELPKDPLIVIGGRRVLLWRGLEDLLAPLPVLMRGLGDATVDDLLYHYDRLVGFYQPQTVVLLPGNSEFHIRDMKTAPQLVESVQALVELDLSMREAGLFYVFTPLNTPLYRSDRHRVNEARQLLKTWARTRQGIRILDANKLLSDAKGNANPDYFRADGVNLNDLGYTRLSMLLLSQLERDFPDKYPAY